MGVRSETFIRRHLEDLCPGRTVAVVSQPTSEEEQFWGVDCPIYNANPKLTISQKLNQAMTNVLGQGGVVLPDEKGISSFLKKHGVTAMLGQYLDHCWPMIGLARKLGIRFFAHAHGYDLSSLFRDPVWRSRFKDFRDADGVVVVNSLMKERLCSIGLPGDMIHIIPCGVDVPAHPITRPKKETVKCVAVGRMVAKKSPLKLLKAFHAATESLQGLSLDYVGDGELYAEAEQYISDYGLSDVVTLHGGQSHDFVMQLLSEADLFLQHSVVDPVTGDEEGLPVAILEAMAMALPVVSTRHAGIIDAVEHGVTGMLVDEGDVDAMTEHILTLAKDRELQNSMGQASWSRVKDRFSWAHEKKALSRLLGVCE